MQNDLIALVLLSLYAELERPALKRIVDILSDVRYINEIVISLDHASALEFRLAKQFFSHLLNESALSGTTALASKRS